MRNFKVGDKVCDWQVGELPPGVTLRAEGFGYFIVVSLPAPKVGDVIDTEAQAAALPVGAVVVDTNPGNDPVDMHPAIKVGLDYWMYHDHGETFDGDLLFHEAPHRVVYLPDADAGAGGTAA